MVVTVILGGCVATMVMFALQFIALRLGLLRQSQVLAAGSLVFPDAAKSPKARFPMFLFGGLAFSAAYMVVFRLWQPGGLYEFMRVGGALGLVHGFFVSLFVLMGTSAMKPERFSLGAIVMNILMHVVFGVMVGLTAGFAFGGGNVLWFSAFVAVLAATAAALVGLLTPSGPRRLHFGGFRWTKVRVRPKWTPEETHLGSAASPSPVPRG